MKPSWNGNEWGRAIECVAKTLASFRNPDDPPPPNEHDMLEAGHIIGALLGQGFVELSDFALVNRADLTESERA